MNKIITVWAALAALLPHRSPAALQVETYGMGLVDEDHASQVLEWVTLTLIHYDYTGTDNLIFSDGSGFIHRQVLTGFLRGQPAFLYRCGEKLWRCRSMCIGYSGINWAYLKCSAREMPNPVIRSL